MIIYCIKNMVTGKLYVGQRKNCNSNQEFQKSNYWGSGIIIHNSIKKNGLENFKKWVLIKNINTKKELDYYEALWIKKLNTIHPKGYNLSSGSGGWGKVHPTTKKKLSEKHKNKKLSEEHKQKISQNAKENPNYGMKGKKHTKSYKENLSEFMKEWYKNPDNEDMINQKKENIRKSVKERFSTEESRIEHGKKLKGRKMPDDYSERCKIGKLKRKERIDPEIAKKIAHEGTMKSWETRRRRMLEDPERYEKMKQERINRRKNKKIMEVNNESQL